ncbi:Aspartate--tRNA ligase, mitochondrial [Armadillidium nasatum]|uniref:Aspartate--tRNA ligase, mitochondrial n=1 Tax=Armadillidium nasatum TaxID=96803 RepID=A0A5N5TAS2_9CRUS|nr:Aspartate--tRNA ligase, mitochondrial [Armadillidium nasatum]
MAVMLNKRDLTSFRFDWSMKMRTIIRVVEYLSLYRSRIYKSQLTYNVKLQKHLNIIPLLIQTGNYGTLIEKGIKNSTCGELSLVDVGTQVKLRGFLQYQRHGMFCVLRDAFGITQVIVNNDELTAKLDKITFESYVEVIGEVLERPEGQTNTAMKTGEIEVLAQELNVVNKARKDIPFLIRNHNMPSESLALKYRYLDLRHPHLQDNLRFRSKVGKQIRDYLQDVENFTEITTPTLSINTPGGAHEFVVPTQFEKKFFSLTQSPQIYKQLAVIGGFEKYFQFAICYRDESGRPDRQAEFMQLDLEMSNANFPEIQTLMESLIKYSWPKELNPLKTPFPIMRYDEAMENYGSDKPDLRFSFKISDVTDIASQSDWTPIRSALQGNMVVAKAFVMTGGGEYIKKSHQKSWEEIAKKEIGLPGVSLLKVQNKNILKPMTGKAFSEKLSQLFVNHLEAKEGDVIVMSVGHKSKVLKLLGKLRLAAAEVLENNKIFVRDKEEFNFLWVTDFPLFEMDETTEKLITCHHPFTAPKPDHIQKLYENPLEVLSQHYDLVLNGCEIAGGSIRIYEEKI